MPMLPWRSHIFFTATGSVNVWYRAGYKKRLFLSYREADITPLNNALFLTVGEWSTLWSVYRRSASSRVDSARNSQVERWPHAYEMSSGVNSQPTYTHVQSEASAPAQSRNATNSVLPNALDNGRAQPSAPPVRSSPYEDITLIDNDLYR